MLVVVVAVVVVMGMMLAMGDDREKMGMLDYEVL